MTTAISTDNMHYFEQDETSSKTLVVTMDDLHMIGQHLDAPYKITDICHNLGKLLHSQKGLWVSTVYEVPGELHLDGMRGYNCYLQANYGSGAWILKAHDPKINCWHTVLTASFDTPIAALADAVMEIGLNGIRKDLGQQRRLFEATPTYPMTDEAARSLISQTGKTAYILKQAAGYMDDNTAANLTMWANTLREIRTVDGARYLLSRVFDYVSGSLGWDLDPELQQVSA